MVSCGSAAPVWLIEVAGCLDVPLFASAERGPEAAPRESGADGSSGDCARAYPPPPVVPHRAASTSDRTQGERVGSISSLSEWTGGKGAPCPTPSAKPSRWSSEF